MPTAELKLARMEAKVSRLRWYIIVMAAILVFFGIIGPQVVARSNRQAVADATVEITCKNFKNQLEMLGALEQIRHELGLPGRLTIPEVPPECVGT